MNLPAEFQADYSRAFEILVNDQDDLVGLIAYSLYKQNIREARRAGQAVHQATNRCPTPTEVATYKGAAEQRLNAFAVSAIDQARPEIMESGLKSDLQILKNDITAEIKSATNIWTQIIIAVLGWLLTIAITFLVVVSGVPSWITILVAKFQHG